MTTGEIIKNLRTERGWSQEQLAEMMGYSHKSSINKIEMGKSDLPQSKLVAFAKIFNISPCDLLGIEDCEPASDEQKKEWDDRLNPNLELRNEVLLIESIQKQFGKKAVKLLHLFAELNDQGQAKAIENLEDLAAIEKYTGKDN